MWELLKFRNLKKHVCATVVSDVFPYPRFAPHHMLLGYAVTTGLRNTKNGRDLCDVMCNSTQCYVLHMSDSSVYKKTEDSMKQDSSDNSNRVTTEKSASAVQLVRASMKTVFSYK
jgi:hypothetical protein